MKEFKVRNLDNGNCLVRFYRDDLLLYRWYIKGHYKGGDVQDFIDEAVSTEKCYSCFKHLDNFLKLNLL